MSGGMKRGFTLVELLVTVGIMAMLGTAAIGGYYAAVRGMSDRAALTDARGIVRIAAQRAFADHLPTAVFFENQLLQAATKTAPAVVVGKVTALRMAGRITSTEGGDLIDEFADLDRSYPTNSTRAGSAGRRLYKITQNSVEYSIVEDGVKERIERATMLFSGQDTNFTQYAFVDKGGGNASWKAGDAYAFEIASVTLPHGYYFGSSYPSEAGMSQRVGQPYVFDPDQTTANLPDIEVSAMNVAGERRKVGQLSDGD